MLFTRSKGSTSGIANPFDQPPDPSDRTTPILPLPYPEPYPGALSLLNNTAAIEITQSLGKSFEHGSDDSEI